MASTVIALIVVIIAGVLVYFYGGGMGGYISTRSTKGSLVKSYAMTLISFQEKKKHVYDWVLEDENNSQYNYTIAFDNDSQALANNIVGKKFNVDYNVHNNAICRVDL